MGRPLFLQPKKKVSAARPSALDSQPAGSRRPTTLLTQQTNPVVRIPPSPAFECQPITLSSGRFVGPDPSSPGGLASRSLPLTRSPQRPNPPPTGCRPHEAARLPSPDTRGTGSSFAQTTTRQKEARPGRTEKSLLRRQPASRRSLLRRAALEFDLPLSPPSFALPVADARAPFPPPPPPPTDPSSLSSPVSSSSSHHAAPSRHAALAVRARPSASVLGLRRPVRLLAHVLRLGNAWPFVRLALGLELDWRSQAPHQPRLRLLPPQVRSHLFSSSSFLP